MLLATQGSRCHTETPNRQIAAAEIAGIAEIAVVRGTPVDIAAVRSIAVADIVVVGSTAVQKGQSTHPNSREEILVDFGIDCKPQV